MYAGVNSYVYQILYIHYICGIIYLKQMTNLGQCKDHDFTSKVVRFTLLQYENNSSCNENKNYEHIVMIMMLC